MPRKQNWLLIHYANREERPKNNSTDLFNPIKQLTYPHSTMLNWQ